MYKGFNQGEFMAWLESEFNMGGRFAIDLVLNIIEYAHKHEHVSLDQFCYFVSDMIPEIEMLDVARFCEDSILTNTTLRELGRIK